MLGAEITANGDLFKSETKRWYIATQFYAAFHELSDQKGLPKPGRLGSDAIMDRAEQVLIHQLLPDLNKKNTDPAQQIAEIPTSKFVLAAYTAAAQQNTGWFGRTARAEAQFERLRDQRFEQQGLRALGLMDNPATKAWVQHTRQRLTYTLREMG